MENTNDYIGLVGKGYIKMTIGEDGTERFFITEKGKKALEETERNESLCLED